MPVIQGRTRKEIRQSIGYNLGAMHIGTATGTNNNTTTIFNKTYSNKKRFKPNYASNIGLNNYFNHNL